MNPNFKTYSASVLPNGGGINLSVVTASDADATLLSTAVSHGRDAVYNRIRAARDRTLKGEHASALNAAREAVALNAKAIEESQAKIVALNEEYHSSVKTPAKWHRLDEIEPEVAKLRDRVKRLSERSPFLAQEVEQREAAVGKATRQIVAAEILAIEAEANRTFSEKQAALANGLSKSVVEFITANIAFNHELVMTKIMEEVGMKPDTHSEPQAGATTLRALSDVGLHGTAGSVHVRAGNIFECPTASVEELIRSGAAERV